MKKTLLGLAKLAVSVSLLWYLVSIVDIGDTLERFQGMYLGFAGVALVFLISQVALSSLKWKLILQADGMHTPYLLLLRSYYIGNFLSLFLPSSIGGDIYRVYAVTSENKRLAKTTSSVLFDRLTGLYALLTIALLAYVFSGRGPYGGALILLYIAGLVGFFLVTSEKTIQLLSGSSRRLVKALAALIRSFRAYQTDRRTLLRVVSISLLFQFMIVVINKLYALALSISISFHELLIIVPLVYLTEVLPISINGIGVRDGAFVFFFVSMGYAKEEGLAVGILVLAMRYVSGLIGGAVLTGLLLQQHFGTKPASP